MLVGNIKWVDGIYLHASSLLFTYPQPIYLHTYYLFSYIINSVRKCEINTHVHDYNRLTNLY